MAEQEPTPEQMAAMAADNDDDTPPINYKAPAKKTLQEISEMDKDDESLRKYKETLLGFSSAEVTADPNAPNVQVTKMTLVVCNAENAPKDVVIDLTGNLVELKNNPFVLKEGVEYKIKISFKVNKEIVSGLRYCQQSYRKGIKLDKSDYMVGSYGPRPAQEYEFLTTMEEAPKGMIARGTYNIKSKFTDDDKHDHLSWEWSLTIKKDW
ncbi:rho GDP-dissociation inhibitor 1 [Gouania willdenowi]|uniref:Rho GDP-dissociation inhibitor 1 n=1 Tax=Gouania willdenowi TaxID=441366 RepID=A0A8C5G9A7_GOUWI|nr:rho GDP-dissociation inhibitor 1-like [Gouania willdenowi]